MRVADQVIHSPIHHQPKSFHVASVEVRVDGCDHCKLDDRVLENPNVSSQQLGFPKVSTSLLFLHQQSQKLVAIQGSDFHFQVFQGLSYRVVSHVG